MENNKIRLRFAPSPTGMLHIGGARTALFNWLYARYSKGTFILRIEDTDQVRSTEEAVNVILEGMKWLGLDWDEGPGKEGKYGPYYQMQRLSLYKKYAQQLLKEKKAYYCYCTKEELAESRKRQLKVNKSHPKYDRHCLNLSDEEKRKYEKEGRKPVIRYKIPEKKIVFNDLLRGEVSFDGELLSDFVIVKSDGIPTYNYAVVIDDALMNITHVMRGDDHISNTPKQILLYEALGFDVPKFAHIPMIMGEDHAKLSKRHGAASVMEYRKMGYMPEALVNYIAHLGWSPGNDREIFSIEEIIKQFSLKNISKHAAVFSTDKLNWFNNEYLKKMPVDSLTKLLLPYLKEADYIKDEKLSPEKFEWVKEIVKLMLGRFRNFSQFIDYADYFFTDKIDIESKAFRTVLNKDGVLDILTTLKEKLSVVENWDEESLEDAVRGVASSLKIKAGKIIHPTRVSLTGKKIGPGLFELMVVLGQEKNVKRIEEAIEKIKEAKKNAN
ncbi:MAG: glutamate--tRNA ligase [Candidatus Caldatribacteriota bacterium]|nr:glutamate--tRNA ligase [Candidatus Caldatribacteriota bacterium]